MTAPLFGTVPRVRLTAAIESGAAPHLRPLLEACRDHGVTWATVPQRAGRFDIPSAKPTVLVIGDDMWEARGPAAFHRKSIRRFAARCRVAVIVACEPQTIFYAMAASCAVALGKDALVVETLPRWEASWANLIREVNPSIALTIGTVKPASGGIH